MLGFSVSSPRLAGEPTWEPMGAGGRDGEGPGKPPGPVAPTERPIYIANYD